MYTDELNLFCAATSFFCTITALFLKFRRDRRLARARETVRWFLYGSADRDV